MPARLMATTGLTGLRVDCLSALVRGGAGTAVGAVAGVAAAGADVGSSADVDLWVDVDL
jgi:hypothetical protein